GHTIFSEVGKIIGLGMSDVAGTSETGNLHLGTTTIDGLTDTSALFVGETVEGVGIAAGTVISSIGSDGTSITISHAALADLANAAVEFEPQSQTGNTHGTITIDGLQGTAGLYVGEVVAGSGIAAGTVIAGLGSDGHSITLNRPTTTTVSNIALT